MVDWCVDVIKPTPAVQGLGIAPQHCHIAEHSGGLWLTNLCSEPHRVFLNGKSMEVRSGQLMMYDVQ